VNAATETFLEKFIALVSGPMRRRHDRRFRRVERGKGVQIGWVNKKSRQTVIWPLLAWRIIGVLQKNCILMCCRQQGNKNFDCHCQVQWLYLFAAEYLF
jgi:hypothetical protein